MSRSNLVTSILTACLLAVGVLGIAQVADATLLGRQSLQVPDSASGPASGQVVEIKYRRRGVTIHLPRGPGIIYYDYPYYYSRGHYPTHIGGYVYYPPYPKYGYRCSIWQRECAAKGGRRQRGACRCY